MRKYTKPVMEMEKIEMNQAIAACNDPLTYRLIGYRCMWCGASENSDSESAAEEHAKFHGTNVQNAISLNYEILLEKSMKHIGYAEDYSGDGTIDNVQDVDGSYYTKEFLS